MPKLSMPWMVTRVAHDPSMAMNVPPGWYSESLVGALVLFEVAKWIICASDSLKICLMHQAIHGCQWRLVSWRQRVFAFSLSAAVAAACHAT